MKGRTSFIYSVIITIFFIVWIFFPIVSDMFCSHETPKISTWENRAIASKPDLKMDNPDPFPSAYESYYNDYFYYRNTLLEIHTQMNYCTFDKSPCQKNVIKGKDNWLFTAGKEREVYEGKFMLTEASIDSIVKELHNRTIRYKERGITFYVFFAPMKYEIYPEMLPVYIQRSPNGTVTDKIIEKIKKDTCIKFIPLKDYMIKSKSFGRLYHKNDNHWNELGGFFAEQAVAKYISRDFPEIVPLSEKDFRIEKSEMMNGNLISMVGMADFFPEENLIMVGKTNAKGSYGTESGYPPPKDFVFQDLYEEDGINPNSKLPKAVIIRDSYHCALTKYSFENFRKTVLIFDAWQYTDNMDIVDKEKPDIVILEIFEPHISNMLLHIKF